MVSKIIKRTPTKSIKNRRNVRRSSRKKSPAKNPASVVVASINKSLYTCHRRLIKLFSKFARLSTPKRSPSKKGYQLLGKVFDEPENGISLRRSLFNDGNALPPLVTSEKKTIFLDLDETLVHSNPNPPPEKYDFVVRPVIDGHRVEFYVLKRPFLDEFLEFLSEKFEVVVFTAGLKEYASLVLDRIDRKGLISHRLYRDSCKDVDGKFVKDLADTGRDMKRVVIVDDNPNSYLFQPENAIPIRPFTDDLADGELKKLIEFLGGCNEVEDMRDAVKVYLAEEEECISVEI
ncbi:CTD small phosphatase-like protein [Capsicum chacoense]